MATRRSSPSMLSTRLTSGAVTTSLSWVPLAAARWHALAIASTAAWSQDTVLVISAISTVAPRLITESSRSRSWSTLEISTCSGNETIARRPVHVAGNRSSAIATYLLTSTASFTIRVVGSSPRGWPGREGRTPGPDRALLLPGGLRPGAGLLDRAGRAPVPGPPDEPVHRDPPRYVAQAGDERDEQQQYGGHAGHEDGDQVDVAGVTPARLHVVPHLEQPQPGLAGVAAGLVHHPPIVTGQVLSGRQIVVVVAIRQEQQRLGEVGAVELALGEQVGVDRAAAGQGELAGQDDRDRAVVARRHHRVAVDELHLGGGAHVVGRPLVLQGGGRGLVGGQGGLHRRVVRGRAGQRSEHEILRRVDRLPDPGPGARGDQDPLRVAVVVVRRPEGGAPAGRVQLGGRGAEEAARVDLDPALHRDRRNVRRGQQGR